MILSQQPKIQERQEYPGGAFQQTIVPNLPSGHQIGSAYGVANINLLSVQVSRGSGWKSTRALGCGDQSIANLPG